MNRCRHCPTIVADSEDLCPACAIELAYRIMAAEPDPVTIPYGIWFAPIFTFPPEDDA